MCLLPLPFWYSFPWNLGTRKRCRDQRGPRDQVAHLRAHMTWLGCATVFVFGLNMGIGLHRESAESVIASLILTALTLYIDEPSVCGTRNDAPQPVKEVGASKISVKKTRRKPVKMNASSGIGNLQSTTQLQSNINIHSEKDGEGEWTVVCKRRCWYSDC